MPYQGRVAKVTSKLQVTVPKAIAAEYGIRPGDDIEWIPAGSAVRVCKATPHPRSPLARDIIAARLELFDLASKRQKARQQKARGKTARTRDRGWRRDDLYDRGSAG
ncbi:AbrB/MazE/SpoVT family DNA-binding domain-containing protein [Candidatus Binatia bacterium]|nr:AbrB/MazE/SpoVT family DNA-binding domain-containing protein [Candidatus Binatia bacterium]